jgi:6,7-dimethyl-8-ribityllumazine synthase
MASKHKSLSASGNEKFPEASKYKIGIVVSAYHEQITFALRDGCIATLKKHGVQEKHIYLQMTPGAFELPLAAGWLYDKSKADAIICLGCVIKGDTDHDVYINNAVSQALMNLSLETKAPFIFGLLTPNTEQQAKDRAGGKYGNKGDECAVAALKMLALKSNLKKKK